MTDIEVRIANIVTSVGPSGVVATFVLEGRPVDPQWQGGFALAMAGALKGSATRWWFDGSSVVVMGVTAGQAGQVADAVRAAVDAGNRFVAELTRRGAEQRTKLKERDDRLQSEAAEAAAVIRERLGM